MRNLFLFLWRHHFFILFLFIEAISILLIVQNSNFHHASVVNSTNKVAAKLNEGISSVTEYVKLKNTNEALARQNAALRTLMRDAYYIDSALKKNITDTIYRQQYGYITAKVISNSTNRRNNYLTLNRGKMQGIAPEMGVICAQGVVGIVKDVSDHYASVISLLHKEFQVSAMIKKNGFYGPLVWGGYDAEHGSLKDIARHVVLHNGDTVVTSGFSGVFPEGIMIGTIEKFEAKAGDNFYNISVKLSTDFGSLSHVFVVTNTMKDEQRQLEEKNEKQ
jgi:rod shape-determining protein MreC